ncbi:hypothetical protein ILUMI_03066 [Ignelater luminosus]|uniref:Transposase n=1 Tax=Ignelater luminosus TaxID=2038154 RepID=A0A8K0GFV8_IGNLU|nr:hypothetical protein ILUMI_03066 [Ignelater luminosus]
MTRDIHSCGFFCFSGEIKNFDASNKFIETVINKKRAQLSRIVQLDKNRGIRKPKWRLRRYWVRQFEAEGTPLKNSHIGRPRVGRSRENIESARAAVAQMPRCSIKKQAATLNLSKSTVHTILKLHLYKIQIVQALKRKITKLQSAEYMLQNFNNFNSIMFSDETHFHVNEAQPLHSPKVIVWAAMSASEIIGPYFFEDWNQPTVTVNAMHYREMLENFLEPESGNFCGFSKTGRPLTLPILQQKSFKGCFPKRSYHRTAMSGGPPEAPMAFFLRGNLTLKVYDPLPANLNQVK